MKEGTESLWAIEGMEGIEGRRLASERITVLEGLLKTTYGPRVSVPSFHRLRSKKNIVLQLLLDDDVNVVVKLFIEPSFAIEEEVLALGMKWSLAMPLMIAAREGVILMEHIDGVPLVDALNEQFASSLVDRLAAWYHTFHDVTGHVKGDPRLRNFILREDMIYGIDFEEYHRGHWMEDLGGVSASILDTRPVFDKRKVRLVWHLLESYLSLSGRDRNKRIDTQFTAVIADTLEQTAHWRQDDQLLTHALRVRQHGLPDDR